MLIDILVFAVVFVWALMFIILWVALIIYIMEVMK